MDEIPANPIENENSSFSPIKFVVKKEKESQELEVIDEEISINKMATGKRGDIVGISECESQRSDTVATEEVNTVTTVGTCDIPETMDTMDIVDTVDTVNNSKIQRRSDEDSICNTPKRERNENEKLNRRFTRQLQEADGESVAADDDGDILILDGDASLPKTPQKQINNTFTTTNNNPNNPNSATTTADSTHNVTSNNNNKECVRSLSQEFEQRLNSIHVSPITTNNTTSNKNNNSTSRSMSPIRSIAQLSPVSKLNLNDTGDDDSNNININSNNTTGSTITENGSIITPKLVSPSKIASQVEIEKIKCDLESKWSKQVEFLQFEVSSIQEKYENSIKSNSEMRTMLAEYEKTLAQFIDARRTKPDQHSSIDQLLQDKKKLELEIQTLQISYQNFHQRYEDLRGLQEQSRINDATLRQSIQVLQQELASTVRNLENTRRLYEEKIEKINTESKSTTDSLEYELSATKAKLLKSELKISSLESAIETKTRENSELMTICDELIHKMDKRST